MIEKHTKHMMARQDHETIVTFCGMYVPKKSATRNSNEITCDVCQHQWDNWSKNSERKEG